MFAQKKLSRYINNKFTLNQQVLALLSLMRKIMQLQKKGQKIYIYFNYCQFHMCKCGTAVKSQSGSSEIAGSSPTCAVQFAQGVACQTEDQACWVFLRGFTTYLRNSWSINLQAIENCIFFLHPRYRTYYEAHFTDSVVF